MIAAAPEPETKEQEVALYVEARELAARGQGWEDLYVKLKDKGLTRKAARIIVFGKHGKRK